MNWNEVYNWLVAHGHMTENWEVIGIGYESLYAEDSFENTFLSMFTRGANDELVVIVGCLKPKTSVGGSTGFEVKSHEDVIYWLEDHLEDMYDELMRKVAEQNG